MARSQEGLIEGESMLPPFVFMALYPAKKTFSVHEELASEKETGLCCSSYSCISPSPRSKTPPGRNVDAISLRKPG